MTAAPPSLTHNTAMSAMLMHLLLWQCKAARFFPSAALWGALFALGWGAGSAGAGPLAHADEPAGVSVRDDRGVEHAFARPPARIVSLLPSLTESMCALDACARLVGVDRYSNHPQALANVPKVGGGLDPDIEAIVALKPDVVLAASASRAALRLESLGLKVLAFNPQNQADVQRVLQVLGAMLYGPSDGRARAQWHAIEADLTRHAQQVPAALRGARVFIEVGQGPYAAGPDSFLGEIVAQLGLNNVVPAPLGAFPRLNPEFVVDANPDVVLTTRSHAQAWSPYPGWRHLRAFQNQHVCTFMPAQIDVLVRPGPRMAQAAQAIADCLQRLATAPPPAF